jgi:hypothetical protein
MRHEDIEQTLTVVALEYKKAFHISAPFDADKFPPERMAAKIAFWRHGFGTHPDSWIVEQTYRVNRDHWQGARVPYDTLIFFRHSTEPTVNNPFDAHKSEWLILRKRRAA